MTEPRIIDAYRYPRLVREGCQHQMGCRCDPPFWLRFPSPAEESRFANAEQDASRPIVGAD